MVGKLKEKGLVRVSVYLNEQELTAMAQEAEKRGLRRVGLPLRKQKEHGFSHEWEANTDGLSVLLKWCYDYYRREEPKRLKRLAEISQEIARLEAEKKELSG